MAADIPEDPSSRHFRFPLHVHISTLFFLLVLLAGGSDPVIKKDPGKAAYSHAIYDAAQK